MFGKEQDSELRELNAHLATSDAGFARKVLTAEGFQKWLAGDEDLTWDDFKEGPNV